MLGLTTSEYQSLILSVGTHRTDRVLTPIGVARLLAKAIEAGTPRKSCSEALGLGMSQLATFLNLNKINPQIQELANWRGTANAAIAFSTLSQLAVLSPKDQLTVAEAILRHRITRKETEQIIQINNRSRKNINDCIADTLQLRPQIETRHVLFGAITEERVREKFQSLTQADRNRLMSQALDTVVPEGYPVDGHLTAESFTLVSNHNIPTLLGIAPDQFEELVNAELADLGSNL